MQTPFVLLQDDWIQIAPLGDHPHQLGIQRITPDSAAAMANRFNSFRARLGRLFSGVPMFEGHHDTDPDKYPNGRSFAWVMELQNRAADGLWAKMKWTDEGRDLVATGKYKFISPVWNAREVTRENGRPIFIPETLLSLALTNLPNLPLPPLANEQQHMNTITELLELPNEATPDQIIEAVTRLKGQVTTLTNESGNLRQSESSAVERFDSERSARIELILANAIAAGRITEAELTQWQTDLTTDFDQKSAALDLMAPKLNTQSLTRDLGNQKELLANEQTRRAELVAFLAEKQASGMSYDEAWSLAKKERSEIFTNMRTK